MPDDPAVAVTVVLGGLVAGWTRADLARVERLIRSEYVGPDKAAALARIEQLRGPGRDGTRDR